MIMLFIIVSIIYYSFILFFLINLNDFELQKLIQRLITKFRALLIYYTNYKKKPKSNSDLDINYCYNLLFKLLHFSPLFQLFDNFLHYFLLKILMLS